jgi:hypothetical protein
MQKFGENHSDITLVFIQLWGAVEVAIGTIYLYHLFEKNRGRVIVCRAVFVTQAIWLWLALGPHRAIFKTLGPDTVQMQNSNIVLNAVGVVLNLLCSFGGPSASSSKKNN